MNLYKLIIRQPDFVTDEIAHMAIEIVTKKKIIKFYKMLSLNRYKIGYRFKRFMLVHMMMNQELSRL